MASTVNSPVKSVEARIEDLQCERAMEFGDALALSSHPLFQEIAFRQTQNDFGTQKVVHHA